MRLRRQQARVRLLLVSDVAVLARHHASEVPHVAHGGHPPGADLRGELDLLRRELLELRALVVVLSAAQASPLVFAGVGGGVFVEVDRGSRDLYTPRA